MAKKLLLTAFKGYGSYPCNVSEQALLAIAEGHRTDGPDRPGRGPEAGSTDNVRGRLYDVCFDRIERHLQEDLTPEIGAAILMGQAPGRATIDLERFAINAGVRPESADEWFALEPGGPEALKSDLPLADWTRRLKGMGIPACESFHAGTYLCNASLYYALRNFQNRGLAGAAFFLHLPLAHELFPQADVGLPMETILKGVAATIDYAMEWIANQERDERSSLV